MSIPCILIHLYASSFLILELFYVIFLFVNNNSFIVSVSRQLACKRALNCQADKFVIIYGMLSMHTIYVIEALG